MFRFLFFICLIFASCSKEPSSSFKQVARLSLQSEPSSLDPRTARDLDGGVLLRMLFEGLMRQSSDGSLENGLAEKVDVSDDGLRYRFHLREAKWSNGSFVTAKDFLFAWKSILDPQFATDIAYHLFPIQNARSIKMGEKPITDLDVFAEDPRILIVILENPTPYFLALVSTPPFYPVPESIVSVNPNWANEAHSLVSNGPFQMESWKHADELVLKKNPHYWESSVVQLSGIDLSVASSDTAFRMFEENKLDWVGSPLSVIPRDAIETLKTNHQLESSPFLATGFCRLNVDEKIGGKENPLSKAEFRRALALSLDRVSIVENLLKGGQTIATSLVPKEMGIYGEGYFSDNRLDEAIALLNNARRDLDFSPIVISYRNDERSLMLAQVLQRQWQDKLGLDVAIEAIEPKVYFQRVSQRNFQIAIGSWTADFNDPINFLEVFKFKNNGTNNTGWENSEYIDLLNQSALCKDLEARKEILWKAEAILMKEMPIIPIYHFALNYVKTNDLVGVSLSTQGYLDLRTASFEKR
jgi:oligopeptide transport system substrate-binding protein